VGETTYQIEDHIEKTRGHLDANLHELEYKVKEIGDWRHHFKKHPMTVLAAAFGGGALIGVMLNGRSHRNHVRSYARALETPTSNGTREKVADALGQVKHALIGVATARLTDFVADLIPGFKEEFRKADSRYS
jgi:hypothetical protein